LNELAAAAGGVYTAVSNSDADIDRLFRADSSQSVSGVSDLERQADIWLERGPFIVLLLLPFAALSFRRGWL
jgi:Ca-activated chloride channel family protein